jgi:Cu(I)/Ag(I) efflux system membrane fusion protein
MNANYFRFAVLICVAVTLGAAGGYWWGRQDTTQRPVSSVKAASDPPSGGDRKVLYWYDPMYPLQPIDKPSKSPILDIS